MKLVAMRKKRSEDFWLWAYADLITNLLIFFVALLSVADINQVKFQEMAEKLTGDRPEQSLAAIKEKLDGTINALGYTQSVSADLTKDGLEISFDSGVMFASGDAKIENKWLNILGDIMTEVVPYANDYHFAVEGHTDSHPLAPGSIFPSNWELSGARAQVIRVRLEKIGVAPTRMRTESYADTKPLDQQKLTGLNQNEIDARHRRVVIRIY